MSKSEYKCSHCGAPMSHRGYCPSCESEYKKMRYDKDKAHRYYLKNRDMMLIKSTIYNYKNKERIKEYQRAYRNLGINDMLMEEYKLKYKKK